VALDPEHRLVLAVVPGKRTAANCRAAVAEAHRRTGGRVPRLITTDEYPSYKPAIADVYGRRVVPLPVWPRRGGRPRGPRKVLPAGLNYAVVHKHRDAGGRVTRVDREVVFGTEASVAAALKQSRASRSVNTALVERQHATDRHRNARKARATYRFSKDYEVHASMTYFTTYSYNFCWPVRTLGRKGDEGRRVPHTPAMAAGLAHHVWSIREWATLPTVQSG
jgi:IS1 family transposase